MPYYNARGDFYRGDFYRGDFFSRAKKIAAVVGAPLVALGTKLGATRLGAAVASKLPGIGTAITIGNAAYDIYKGIRAAPAVAGAGAAVGAGAVAAAEHFMPGGRSLPALPGGMVPMGGRHARGHELPHCGVPLKSGRLGKCHRSMNVTNVHALRKAMRRVHGFEKLARRTISFTKRVHLKHKGGRRR